MRVPITLSEIPARVSAGAFILNSGLSKRDVDEATAAQLHGFAAGTYPFVKRMQPRQFVTALSTAEIVLGAALLAPVVPTALAGAALTVFSGGLLGLYLNSPGMRKPGSLAPTQEGLALAKDAWLAGIGLSMLIQGIVESRPRVSVRKAAKQVSRAEKAARRAAVAGQRETRRKTA